MAAKEQAHKQEQAGVVCECGTEACLTWLLASPVELSDDLMPQGPQSAVAVARAAAAAVAAVVTAAVAAAAAAVAPVSPAAAEMAGAEAEAEAAGGVVEDISCPM